MAEILRPIGATNEPITNDELRNGLKLKPIDVMDLYNRFEAQTDSNHDGFITKQEIEYDSPRDRTWEEGQILAAFELYMGDIEELSNDERGDEKSGISRDDVETLVGDWNNDDNLDLIRRLNFISQRTLRGQSSMGDAWYAERNDVRKFYAKAGGYTGFMVGGVAGAALAESTGLLLAPAIPIGLMVGGKYGHDLGDAFGRWRAGLISYDAFARDYVDNKLGL